MLFVPLLALASYVSAPHQSVGVPWSDTWVGVESAMTYDQPHEVFEYGECKWRNELYPIYGNGLGTGEQLFLIRRTLVVNGQLKPGYCKEMLVPRDAGEQYLINALGWVPTQVEALFVVSNSVEPSVPQILGESQGPGVDPLPDPSEPLFV